MDSTQTVSHAEKTCDPCGVTFTPGAYLTAEQAAEVKSCSHGCASARARGCLSGPGKLGTAATSDAIGTLDAHGRCVCSDCNRLRDADRSELIARTAEHMGVPVSAAVGTRRPPPGPNELARVAALNRRRRLENYEPEYTEFDFGDFTVGEI